MSPRQNTTLLLVEDNRGDARLLREMFNEQGALQTILTHVASMADAEAHLSEHAVDVILLDLGLPDAQGVIAVRRAHEAAPGTPIVVITGRDDETLASQALQMGAQDYLIKGQIETRGLMRALRYAIERNNMDAALFVERERAQITLNSIGDAVACTDSAGNVTFLNVVAEVMTGWTHAEAEGRPLTEVISVAVDGDRPDSAEVAQPDRRVSERLLIRRDGSETPIEESIAPIHDREGRPSGAVVVFRDVTVAHAMKLKMKHSAQHDFLTGRPNRMLLDDRIEQAIALAPRHGKQIALLFLDLDGFKQVNDTLGHFVGDQLLKSVSERLVACVRVSDTVSRQGGDEFVVLLSEIDRAEDAALTANRMLDAVATDHLIDSNRVRITTSIGISIYPVDGFDPETLMKRADAAMYHAKQAGCRSYCFFTPHQVASTVETEVQLDDAENRCSDDPFSTLSTREHEVLVLIADGKTNKEIAAQVGLGDGSARNCVRSILNKLNLRRRSEAAAYIARRRAHDAA